MDMNAQAPRSPLPGSAVHPRGAPESDSTREMAAQFEAILFKEAFAPLAKAMGFYGDAVVTAAAQAMTRSAGGLTDPITSAIDAAARDGALR
jgi:hypothetical protein